MKTIEITIKILYITLIIFGLGSLLIGAAMGNVELYV